jgi:hypothetical protein
MGKDNVPFHTVIFPATLLGTGKPWTMMRNISVTEYLNYEGGGSQTIGCAAMACHDVMQCNVMQCNVMQCNERDGWVPDPYTGSSGGRMELSWLGNPHSTHHTC